MIKQPITLPIFFHTDGTSQLKDLGIEYELTDCEIRHIDLFEIGAIAEHTDAGKSYTSVFTHGFEFICALHKSKVLDLIISRL